MHLHTHACVYLGAANTPAAGSWSTRPSNKTARRPASLTPPPPPAPAGTAHQRPPGTQPLLRPRSAEPRRGQPQVPAGQADEELWSQASLARRALREQARGHARLETERGTLQLQCGRAAAAVPQENGTLQLQCERAAAAVPRGAQQSSQRMGSMRHGGDANQEEQVVLYVCMI